MMPRLPSLEEVTDIEAGDAGAFLVQLSALALAVASRVAATVPPPAASPVDALVDVQEAAKLLCMSPSWVYRNASSFPFTRRLPPRTLRFSVEGIRRYLAKQRS